MSFSDSKTRYKEILDDYDDFRTYSIIGSLRATDIFGCSDICRCMILVDSRVIIVLSHNNNNTRALSIFLVPYLHESYRTVIVTNRTTKASQNSNPLCT